MVVDLRSLFKGFRHPISLKSLLLRGNLACKCDTAAPKMHACQGVLLSVCRASAVPNTSCIITYNKFTIRKSILDTLA